MLECKTQEWRESGFPQDLSWQLFYNSNMNICHVPMETDHNSHPVLTCSWVLLPTVCVVYLILWDTAKLLCTLILVNLNNFVTATVQR